MSTDLAINGAEIDPRVLEQVVVGGDLSRLNPSDRLAWYRARCDAAGLDPRTQPFQYITLQGKLTLYATKTATDQLIASRKLTVEIVDRQIDKDSQIYSVQCRVKFADGHHVEDFAALSIAGLKGDALCNALMKAVSKAKRRTVLSACGLGMLDETETETIPGATRVDESALNDPTAHHAINHNNNSGYGSGAYAKPEAVAKYKKFVSDYADRVNTKWLDTHAGHDGEVAEGVKDLVNSFQLGGHLHKYARGQKLINAPDEVRSVQSDKLTAVWWERDHKAVEKEAQNYCLKLWRDATEKLAPRPEDETQEREPGADDVIEVEPEDDGAFEERLAREQELADAR